MEYLEFWVTRVGVEPIARNIEAMQNTKPPTSRKKIQNFIVVVNYYRNIWARSSHTLLTITNITSNKVNVNGLKPKNILLAKLSGLWSSIIY